MTGLRPISTELLSDKANVSLLVVIVGFFSFFLREFIGCGVLTDKSDRLNCCFCQVLRCLVVLSLGKVLPNCAAEGS
jgi:hypothetical protein